MAGWYADDFLGEKALGWVSEVEGGPVVLELEMLETADRKFIYEVLLERYRCKNDDLLIGLAI
jgi:hypothetical protein